MQCDLDEFNIVDLEHGLSIRGCQSECRGRQECHWFTWYQASPGDTSLCLLLEHCDDMEACPGCVSGQWSQQESVGSVVSVVLGPAEGVDVEACMNQEESTSAATTPPPTASSAAPTASSSAASTETTVGPTEATSGTSAAPTATTAGSTAAPTGTTEGSYPPSPTTVASPTSASASTAAPTGTTDATSAAPSTSAAATTTAAPTTTVVDCGVFHEAACDITEQNTVDVKHDLTVGGCQDMCAGNGECHVFTWYPSLGNLGICFLLKECNDLEKCPYCVSGPESGVDVDSCYDFTTPATTTTNVGNIF